VSRLKWVPVNVVLFGKPNIPASSTDGYCYSGEKATGVTGARREALPQMGFYA